MNLDWSECQDLWGDRPPKDQLADKSKTAKEIPPKRGSPAEDYSEEQLSRDKKRKRMTRYKIGTSVLKHPSQEQLDKPRINLKYRNEQPSRQKKNIRGANSDANKDDYRLSPSIGSGGRPQAKGSRTLNLFDEGPRDDPEERLDDLQAISEL